MSRWDGVTRSDWVWLALPYAFAILGAVVTASSGQVGGRDAATASVLTVVVLAWHTWWAVLHPNWLERRLAPMVLYYAGLVIGSAALLSISFTFLPLYLVCLPMAFVAIPGRWAYVGVAVSLLVGVVAPTLPVIQIPTADNVVGIVAGGLLAAVAGGAIRHAENQARARQQTLIELEAAIAQNQALQQRVVAEERAAAARRERDRIAAQIHDTFAADLAGVVAQLEALASEQPDLARLDQAAASARSALRTARESVGTLRTPPSQVPLADQLRALALDRASPRIDVDVTAADELGVDPVVADALVRGAREALRNAVRHARSTRVQVTLTDLADRVAVDVVDDGAGFDATAPRAGHGLAITRERLEEVGGGLVVQSSPGEGTAVTMTVPR